MTEEDIQTLHKVICELSTSRRANETQFNTVLRLIQTYGHAVVIAEADKLKAMEAA